MQNITLANPVRLSHEVTFRMVNAAEMAVTAAPAIILNSGMERLSIVHNFWSKTRTFPRLYQTFSIAWSTGSSSPLRNCELCFVEWCSSPSYIYVDSESIDSIVGVCPNRRMNQLFLECRMFQLFQWLCWVSSDSLYPDFRNPWDQAPQPACYGIYRRIQS